MSEENINKVIENMKELMGDADVPKNVKTKVENAMRCLQEKEELKIRINKALDQLEQIGEDNNIEPYTRSQIWNLVSALEMI